MKARIGDPRAGRNGLVTFGRLPGRAASRDAGRGRRALTENRGGQRWT